VLDATLGNSNITVLRTLTQFGDHWRSPMTMLSRLQWEIGQAQWSDLRGDQHIRFQLQRLQAGVWHWWHYTYRMRVISTVRPAETVIRRKIGGRTYVLCLSKTLNVSLLTNSFFMDARSAMRPCYILPMFFIYFFMRALVGQTAERIFTKLSHVVDIRCYLRTY